MRIIGDSSEDAFVGVRAKVGRLCFLEFTIAGATFVTCAHLVGYEEASALHCDEKEPKSTDFHDGLPS